MDEQASDGSNSPPRLPPDSPGSSASFRLQEEYNELLRYTVLLPQADGKAKLDLSGAFHSPNRRNSRESVTDPLRSPTPHAEVDTNSNAVQPPTSNGVRPNTALDSQPGLDAAVTSMDGKLTGWLAQLKGNVLEEVRSSTVRALEAQVNQQDKESRSMQGERQQLQQEVNRLSELVHTCEQSLARKDTLVENLTKSLADQREKFKEASVFYLWRCVVADKARESFTLKLAARHHQRKLCSQVLKAWFGLIRSRWRDHMERQCQKQAQSVCKQLSTDYETKVAEMSGRLAEMEQHVAYLQDERENYADSVKKAFMRGVCALNMEAMSAFTADQGGDTSDNKASHSSPDASQDVNFNSHYAEVKDTDQVKALPVDPMTPALMELASLPITGHSVPISQGARKTSKPKPATAKPAPQRVLQGRSLAPPMASVVVERHQPITKQTVGKATAVKFPKNGGTRPPKTSAARSSQQSYAPLAGQSLTQSIKVVD